MRLKLPIIVALAMAAIGGCNQTEAVAERPTQPGRYVIVTSNSIQPYWVLLDTATGDMWERVRYTDIEGDPEVWSPAERIPTSADFTDWMRYRKMKPLPGSPAARAP